MPLHRCRLVFLFALLIALLLIPRSVLADIAPPKPPMGSDLEPGTETTNVRMVSEIVTIDVPSMSQYETGQATVTAVFQMRNLGSVQERMDVRFPLCMAATAGPYLSNQGSIYSFPPVNNFSAWVDGEKAPVTETNENMSVFKNGDSSNISVPCWASFSVTFPPNRDVTIKVQYIQVGGYGEIGHGTVNFVTLSYVLFTGAGWKDSIGSADIIARFPVDTDALSISTEPKDAIVSGKEIRWHFENFEPAYEKWGDIGLIKLTFLQPKYWYKMQEERANTSAHPKDGEAWGRLGKAIKDAYRVEHGFMSEPLYWESFDAYQRAVDLLPNDADWHYGFADLVCVNASEMWGDQYTRTAASLSDQIRLCVDQIKQALKINPQHVKTRELLEWMKSWGWVDLSGPEPVYRILTPQPTASQTSTGSPTATVTLTLTQRPSATLPPTYTPRSTLTAAPTRTHAATISPTPPVTPTSAPAASSGSGNPACAAVLLPAIVLALRLLIRCRF